MGPFPHARPFRKIETASGRFNDRKCFHKHRATLVETSAKAGPLEEPTEKYFRFIKNTLVRAGQEIGAPTFAEVSCVV